MVLGEMIRGRFANRPYGWPEMETSLLLARLIVVDEIQLMAGGDVVPNQKLFDALTTPSQWQRTQVVQRTSVDPAAIQNARNLAKDVFASIAPDGEDNLCTFLREKLGEWLELLKQWEALVSTGGYPGKEEIQDGLGIAKNLVGCTDSGALIERFNAQKAELREFSDHFNDLRQFYGNQKPTWDKLRKAYDAFQLNSLDLQRDANAAAALQRMGEILSAPAPYALVKETEGLIAAVAKVNDDLMAKGRERAEAKVSRVEEQLRSDVASAGVDAAVAQGCLEPLARLHGDIGKAGSLAHLSQLEQEADRLLETGLKRLEAAVAAVKGVREDRPDTPKPVIKQRRVVRPSELVGKTYLETREDVESFVGALREELDSAIANNERIQIQ